MRTFLARASIVLACAATGVASTSTARADASLADKAAAQTLFDEGRKLMAAGKYAEACPKLAESQKLDPGVGTQFHLSDCYERLGMTASAWAGFLEAASAAKSMGQTDREKVARERAAALESRLSKLTITSVAADLTGLEIKRDGSPVGRALWGTAIPMDPGAHVIEATAPGKKAWQTTAQVQGDRAVVVVSIPALEDAAAAQPVAEQASVDGSSSGKSRRLIGAVVAGAGVVGLGLGGVFALQAKSKYDDSLGDCTANDKNRCGPTGLSQREDARSAGNVATVAVGVGAAALVAGAVLFFTAPNAPERPRAFVVPAVGPSLVGVSFSGVY